MSENVCYCTNLVDSEIIKVVETNQQLFEPDSKLVDDIWVLVNYMKRESIAYLKMKWRRVKPYHL